MLDVPGAHCLTVFTQGNVAASRKQVAPALVFLSDGLFSPIAPRRHVGASAPRTDVDAHTSRWYVGSNASQWNVCANTPHRCVSCFSRRTVQGNGSRWSVGASKLDPLVVHHKCLMAVVVVSES